MLILRRALGALIPLAAGFLFTWLVDMNAMANENGSLFTLLLLATLGLSGIVGGFLLRSWWAVAIAPIALIVGVLMVSLIRTGAIAQGPIEIVGPLAVAVLAVYFLPTAFGALIGAAIGKRVATRVTHTTHVSHA